MHEILGAVLRSIAEMAYITANTAITCKIVAYNKCNLELTAAQAAYIKKTRGKNELGNDGNQVFFPGLYRGI